MKSETTSTASSVSSLGGDLETSFSEISSGEFRVLTESLDDHEKVSVPTDQPPQLTSLAALPVYGNPLSEEEAAHVVPPGEDGLVWHSIVIPDNFCTGGKLMGGLNKRDYDLTNATIKPRRASLPVTQSELFTSLTKIQGPNGSRFIFNGVLNGWPSLRNFELIELEKKRSIGALTAPDIMNRIPQTWARYWSVDKEGREGISPAIKDTSKIYRAKLRGAPWSSMGWSPESPGFLFWYESQRREGSRVSYGLQAVQNVGDDKCTAVHMISHRYAALKETAKDKITYHSIVLLEWEHGNFCTIVEGAYLNGIGGYKGRSNWYDDKDDGITALYKAMPPEMICPWLTTAAEIRAYDVKAKNLEEMKEFIAKYTGPEKRFLDPHYSFSHPARLTFRSRSNIAQYLINYISRDCSYSEVTRNCQTLAADLCSFVAGKKNVAPYHPLNRLEYYNRTHLFLYDGNMFDGKKKGNLKGKVAK